MNDKIEIPPPPAVPSGRASATKTKIKFEAYTDWLVVACATLLTALDKFPAEWTLWLFIGVAGLMGLMRGMGKSGGATGLVLLAMKKLSIAIGISALLFGCATGTGTTALKILAPLAVDAINAAAERRNVELDKAKSFCEEMVVPLDVDLPGVVVICWTPEIE